MKFYIKNNNLYYYQYPIFNGELSPVIFIIYLIILFTQKYMINYINYISIFIAIVGIIDSILKMITHKLYFIFIITALLHCVFLFPLTNMKKYMKPNICNYVLSIVAVLIITFLPYWPYELSRNNMIAILILINVVFTSFYFLQYKRTIYTTFL